MPSIKKDPKTRRSPRTTSRSSKNAVVKVKKTNKIIALEKLIVNSDEAQSSVAGEIGQPPVHAEPLVQVAQSPIQPSANIPTQTPTANLAPAVNPIPASGQANLPSWLQPQKPVQPVAQVQAQPQVNAEPLVQVAQSPIQPSANIPTQTPTANLAPAVNPIPASGQANLPSWLQPQKPLQPISQPIVQPQSNLQAPVQPISQPPVQAPANLQAPVQPIAQSPVQPAMPSAAPVQPPQPQKPMTLADLAKQTPIFAMDDLDYSRQKRKEMREKKRLEEKKKEEEELKKQEEIEKGQASIAQEPFKIGVSDEVKESEKQEIHEATIVNAEIVENSENNNTAQDESEEESVSIFTEIKEKFKEILKESTITKRQIFGAIGIVILLIFFIILITIGVKWIFSGVNDEITQLENTDVQTEVQQEYQPEINSNTAVNNTPTTLVDVKIPENVFVDASLYVGIMTGDFEFIEKDKVVLDQSLQTGVVTAYSSGLEDISLMPKSINHLKKMKAQFQIELRTYIAESSDPNAAISKYVSDMQLLLIEAENILAKIQSMRSEKKIEYETVTVEKSKAEGLYFASIENQDGFEAENTLKLFIEASQKQIALKAQYKAWGSIEQYYQRYIKAFNVRLQDIEYNKDALIKGVQVYDLENSKGLDLIIEVPSEGL